MNIIKRLSTSVTATLGSAVTQLENHDAIVEATVKQTRQAVAKSKARLYTLKQQQASYQKQQGQALEQANVWEQRAKKLANENTQQALQCMASRNQCLETETRLASTIDQHKTLISGVENNLRALEEKLHEISQRHTLMRSRQTISDVNRAVSKVNLDHDLSDTFERWEAVVLENEDGFTFEGQVDSLDMELTRQENQIELEQQLAALIHPEKE